MENKVIIRKIPLDRLIQTLVDLYNSGVDYVDLMGMQGEEFDQMAITFTKEYMSEAGKENFKDVPEEDIEPTDISQLSADDINQML